MLESDDCIGVFYNDVCVGAWQWDIIICGGGICGIPISDGYTQQVDDFTYKIFDASSDQICPAILNGNLEGYCTEGVHLTVGSNLVLFTDFPCVLHPVKYSYTRQFKSNVKAKNCYTVARYVDDVAIKYRKSNGLMEIKVRTVAYSHK